MRQKNRRKIMILPPSPLSKNFFTTGNFLKHSTEGFSCEVFGYCETKKNSTEDRDITSLSIKLFDTQNFLKHRRDSLRNDSILWNKTILTENRDTRPLSYPSHFSIPEIFWNTEGFLYEYFRHCEAKIFQQKVVIPFCIKSINQW